MSLRLHPAVGLSKIVLASLGTSGCRGRGSDAHVSLQHVGCLSREAWQLPICQGHPHSIDDQRQQAQAEQQRPCQTRRPAAWQAGISCF